MVEPLVQNQPSEQGGLETMAGDARTQPPQSQHVRFSQYSRCHHQRRPKKRFNEGSAGVAVVDGLTLSSKKTGELAIVPTTADIMAKELAPLEVSSSILNLNLASASNKCQEATQVEKTIQSLDRVQVLGFSRGSSKHVGFKITCWKLSARDSILTFEKLLGGGSPTPLSPQHAVEDPGSVATRADAESLGFQEASSSANGPLPVKSDLAVGKNHCFGAGSKELQ
uniref:Uncharacterized protein n=1 Tax=Nelumbo nucifera TaxID=4432 RepID=A0A822YB84_NELNU|nr:TPA_asm: hypothetical protein HUJ06_031030 [Nelumbo nucifera]